MSFILPAFLLTGLLALVVLVLHTTQKRTITIASTQLWRQLQRHATQRRRVWRLPKLSILLVLQILAVLLAAVALAQPFLGARSEPEHWVLVLDGGASMQSAEGEETRFDAAQAALVERLRLANPQIAPHVSVVLASTRPRLVAARHAEVNDALVERVEQLGPLDGAADWSETRSLLSQVVKADEPTRVVVFTDAATGPAALRADGRLGNVEEVRIGTAAPGASVQATLVADPDDEKSLTLDGSVDLTGGLASVALAVEYLADGASTPLQWANLTLAAPEGSTGTVTRAFSEELTLPGPGLVRVRLDDPATPQDNVVNFVVGQEPAAFQILYVGPRDPDLLRALRSIDGASIFEADGLPADLTAFNLAVIDSVEVSRQPETNVLWVGTGRIAGEAEPAEMAGQDFTNWQDAHPLSFGVNWGEVVFDRAYSATPVPGAEVLVEASDNPMVEARTTANGRDVRLMFRPSESNWGQQASFPIFVANVVDWLGPRDAGTIRPPCLVGLPCALDARILGAGFIVEDAWSPDPAAPLGNVFEGDEGRLIPLKAGLFRLVSERRTQLLAINPQAVAPAADEVAAATSEPSSPEPLLALAPWILGALLLVLAVEGWIAGRGPERFLRAAGLSRRNPRAPARRTLLGLRIATLVLVAMALVGVPMLWPEARQNVVLVSAGETPLSETLAGQVGGDRRAGVVEANMAPRVAADLSSARPTVTLPASGFANVEAGVRLAAAMLPAGEPGRVVLAAPPRSSAGVFTDSIPAVRAADARVDVLPAAADAAPRDLAISRLSAPTNLYVGDAFDLSGLVFAPVEQSAEVAVFEAGQELARLTVNLLPGFNWVDTRIGEAKRGATLYEMAISGENDVLPGNDRAGLQIEVDSVPRVLVVSPQPQQGQLFADLLASQGFETTLIAPDKAFWLLEQWLDYDTIVLMNVPALDLQTRQQELIETAVSEHGRGLFIMGGENTFGPGGYFETPLERMSPVSSRVPRESPEAALVFVLDRSGSMSQAVGDVNRLDIAKEATRAAVGLLNRQSRVAIIAFDSESHIVLPLTETVDPVQVENALKTFDAGGGTAIFPGLEDAVRQLEGVDAPARHIIVMTDGLTQRGDFATLLGRAREQNITVSGVAIGRGADATSVREIAELGGGSFHTSVDFQALPSILSQEALLLSGTPIEQGATVPRWTSIQQERFLSALPDALPAISGFVLTTAKPEAELAITTADQKGEQMPLLATWRYGNGRVLSFTTQAVGTWSERWVEMPEYPRMLADTMRAFLPATQPPGITMAALRRGDEVLVRLDALDKVGVPRSGLSFAATATAIDDTDDSVPVPVKLIETAPGRYEGRFPAATSGLYEIETADGDQVVKRRLFIDYPSALDPGAPSESFNVLASATGGRTLTAADPLFGDVPMKLAALPGWPIWTVLALVLFMTDLFVRYGNPFAGWFGRSARRRGSESTAGGASSASNTPLASDA